MAYESLDSNESTESRYQKERDDNNLLAFVALAMQALIADNRNLRLNDQQLAEKAYSAGNTTFNFFKNKRNG